MSVNYLGFVPHLLEAVKELKQENDAMKQQIAVLQQQMVEVLKKNSTYINFIITGELFATF